MKFRRHQPSGGPSLDWGAWLDRLRQRLTLPKTGPQRLAALGGGVVAAFGIGYLIAALVLFPAPIFARSHGVPRLLGLPLGEAEQALTDLGLVAGDAEVANHPTAPRGTVVWQDPPEGVAVPEGSSVALTVSRGPQLIPVPDVAGYERSTAERLIEAAGLVVGRVDTVVAPVERGVVVNTRPTAGESRVPGTGITLFVSVGAATIEVPDLSGLTVEEAQDLLEQAGLVLGSTRTRRTNAAEPGFIIEQRPAAGTLSAPGAAVNVIIARGEAS